MAAILNSIVPETYWIEVLKLVEQNFTLAVILEFSMSRDRTPKLYTPNYENLCLNRKVPVNFHDWSNGFGVILNKFYLAAILKNVGLKNSAIQLPLYILIYESVCFQRYMTHISIIKTASGPSRLLG